MVPALLVHQLFLIPGALWTYYEQSSNSYQVTGGLLNVVVAQTLIVYDA